jgi:hypothetical protein
VRVTHPFHPLFGQEFVFITTRQAWGRWRVQYYDVEGVMRSLPAAWTDAGAIDPFVVRAAGRSILHVIDLVALTELVAGIGAGATHDA